MSTLLNTTRAHTSRHTVGSAKLAARPDAVLNKAGGLAFTLPDSAEKLIYITGQFVGEPKYYDGFSVTPVRSGPSHADRQRAMDSNLAAQGVVKWALPVWDDNVKEVIQCAFAVANSDNPKDLLVIAHWLRKEMNMRLSPALFIAVAARHHKAKAYVREYCQHVLTRLDDIYNVVELWNFLFQGRLPKCLVRGLADALAKQGDYAIMKYGFRTEHPNLSDLLQVVERRAGFPFDKQVSEYVLNGTLPSATDHPQIVAWNNLRKCESFDDNAKELALTAHVTWEDLSSLFATTPEGKRDVWTFLLEGKLLNYMGMMRNLRNIVQSGVDHSLIEGAAEFLSTPDQVRRSRQMPFRFLSAYRAIADQQVDPFVLNTIVGALEQALLISAEDMPILPGKTAIFADNSGSMDQKVSEKSTVSAADAANILCAITAKRGNNIVGAFGTDVAFVPTQGRTIFDIANGVAEADTRGMCTNGYRCPQELMKRGTMVDRVVIFTDEELWCTTNGWGRDTQLATTWQAYARACSRVKGKEPYLHLVNLSGNATTPVPPSATVNLVGGYSEKLIRQMAVFEGHLDADPETGDALPLIQDLRNRF